MNNKCRLFIILICIISMILGSANISMSSNIDYSTGWEIETIPYEKETKGVVSLALDSMNNPHVVFSERNTRENITYAVKKDGVWKTEIIRSVGQIENPRAIQIDSKDRPHIVGCNYGKDALYYIVFTGEKWSVETIDVGPRGPQYACLILDENDNPHICFQGDGVTYLHKVESEWSFEIINEEEILEYVSIAIDSYNNPHIAYYMFDNINTDDWNDLKYAYNPGSEWIVETVDSYGVVGKFCSIGVDSNNIPHISYYNQSAGSLKYAVRQTTYWETLTIANKGSASSITIDSKNNIHISYRVNNEDHTGFLQYINNINDKWNIYNVDSITGYGFISLGIDNLNRPNMCIVVSNPYRIKYAHFTKGDYDEDGYINDNDPFPKDPSASQDTDNDGYPDSWNDGKSQDDSTTGLTLDAFPEDPTEWNDTDEDGVGDNTDLFPEDPNDWEDSDSDTVGDNTDKFPEDPAASLDDDNDGYPDKWNADMDESDSTTNLKIDIFPDDPEEWEDTDNDSIGDNSDAFPTDPSASIDTDEDGLPDSWNDGFGPEDSTSDPPLVIDMYPDDPDNIPPDDDEDDDDDSTDDDIDDETGDDDTSGSESDAIGILLIVGLMAAIIAAVLFFFRKRDDEIEDEQPPPTKKRHQ